ncbi:hypothetical protein A2865_02340 [Candidatus Woesebacteria bacterium RIFCSPHIGHO2_01_FULL_39_17]|uniref:Membrane protein n=3 Tax=Candidatus Woeseibacteriota TaxID=1752722 RepID=A0A0G0QUG9_9BACT|nr:MAG: Membrane protein [Microgenomates group bacterium GW2011_GWC1_38_12]KKQ93921.1 MAG: Membrane protein [Candidatus Woesebacteria bacterium GW2011_GWB1_39_10b]KKR13990.1 MAG: Membrane protein [Candidatus Woesebacteria bacterium GW2011_GWA1_39_21b]OGM23482.1 MAG: hypothetical protein A2865_02340 [Candidatus Woesebacteria bacterium RIFCSPHIGHO2_01_FULL_39_17]OGM64271.1 MAG: hypothetical protein A3A52_03165 [Candidatus Woesebacteria bacterium RIFCSPLOWO2_01_FULL_39_14]
MNFSRESKIIGFVYLLSFVFWIYFLIVTGHSEDRLGFYLQIPLTIIPLLGGIFGLSKAGKWGGIKSAMGRAMVGLSYGLITWALGMVVWDYYIFFTEVEVPYPSLADGFFILSWPFWSYGIFELSKVTGARFGFRLKSGKLLFLAIPVLVSLISYYLLFIVARGGEIELFEGGLKLFFDLFYPIGDVVILTIIVLVYSLSRNFLGGTYKPVVTLLFLGFVFNYFTDFTFSYTTTVGIYFNGHFVDFMFTTTMFILAVAINSFDPDLRKK